MKKIFIYLPEGFADWEGSFLFPELVENKVDFAFVTENGLPVQSVEQV